VFATASATKCGQRQQFAYDGQATIARLVWTDTNWEQAWSRAIWGLWGGRNNQCSQTTSTLNGSPAPAYWYLFILLSGGRR